MIEAGTGKIKKKKKVKGINLDGRYVSLETYRKVHSWKGGTPRKLRKDMEKDIKSWKEYFSRAARMFSDNTPIDLEEGSFTEKEFAQNLRTALRNEYVDLPAVVENIFIDKQYLNKEHSRNDQVFYIHKKLSALIVEPSIDFIDIAVMVMPKDSVETHILQNTLIDKKMDWMAGIGISGSNYFLEIYLRKGAIQHPKHIKARDVILVPMMGNHKHVPEPLYQYPGHIIHLSYQVWNEQFSDGGEVVPRAEIKKKYIGVYHSTKSLESGLRQTLERLGGGK